MTSDPDELRQRVAELERALAERDATIERLDKTRRALIARAVRSSGWDGKGYGLLESQVVLSEQVRRRTQELEELSANLLAAKEEAEAAAKVRSTFLTTMSHEIRTPLNGVLGMATLLAGTELTPEQAEYADTIRTCGDSLLDLINNILDFSKLESRGLEQESLVFDPRDLITEVGLIVGERIRTKKLTFVQNVAGEVPARVVGDQGRLRQVLLNLVGNAVKFTESGSVTVSLEALVATPLRLHFRVIDTGVGIPEGVAPRLFQPFVQADASTTREFGGSGLGLAICRQIVELLGGEIGLESAPGRGSAFWFSVPVQMPEASPSVEKTSAQGGQSAAQPGCQKGRRVLVVEDNTVNQKVAAAMLERMGARVDVAANGREAVDACRRSEYDLVFMDCQMPVMDGYEACSLIRADEAGRGAVERLPIVALTAHSMPGDQQKCYDAGMDDYITKPVSPKTLAETMDKWIGRAVAPPPSKS